MKKSIIIFVLASTVASCNISTSEIAVETFKTVDTIKVDSIKVDSIKVDTIKIVDTLKVEKHK